MYRSVTHYVNLLCLFSNLKLLSSVYAGAVNLSTTSTKISNGKTLVLVCSVDQILGTIVFEFPEGTPVGSCTGGVCESGSYRISQNAVKGKTYLIIDKLDLTQHGGTWLCYQGSERATINVDFYGKAMQKLFPMISIPDNAFISANYIL